MHKHFSLIGNLWFAHEKKKKLPQNHKTFSVYITYLAMCYNLATLKLSMCKYRRISFLSGWNWESDSLYSWQKLNPLAFVLTLPGFVLLWYLSKIAIHTILLFLVLFRGRHTTQSVSNPRQCLVVSAQDTGKNTSWKMPNPFQASLIWIYVVHC